MQQTARLWINRGTNVNHKQSTDYQIFNIINCHKKVVIVTNVHPFAWPIKVFNCDNSITQSGLLEIREFWKEEIL